MTLSPRKFRDCPDAEGPFTLLAVLTSIPLFLYWCWELGGWTWGFLDANISHPVIFWACMLGAFPLWVQLSLFGCAPALVIRALDFPLQRLLRAILR